jgi:hypothetical protein
MEKIFNNPLQDAASKMNEWRHKRETAWKLINTYRCTPGSGFEEWKQDTPQYVKNTMQKLFDSQNDWSKF